MITTADTAVVGFINSNMELEYTEYRAYDGGFIELDDINKYTKEELIDILVSFVNLNKEEIEILT
ncbi:MAG: hypothetical protein H8E76_09595 [Helicobacteraceae bacterium]|nr:hypothetical protein [Candidatus Sulfurimonas ponti]